MTAGAGKIVAERLRQMGEEGFDFAHDDEHDKGELGHAARCYLFAAWVAERGPILEFPPVGWPWDDEWWKPSQDPVGNLVKAGALVAAEIDRLERKKERACQT